MKLPSASQHVFSQVPRADIPRSVFDRSQTHKTMFDSGYLIPFYIDEVLPGDTFNVHATLFARLTSALTLPVMDNLYLDTFYFYVPNRLVWANFQKFCGEQTNPNDSTVYVTPQIVAPASTGWTVGTLSDYFGLPLGVPSPFKVSALWHRAYNLIWNQWFRDENLQNSVTVDTGDSDSTSSNYVLLRRGKRHDYFTSCLPWAQKGTAVSIPLGTQAPVTGISVPTTVFASNVGGYETGSTGGTTSYPTGKVIGGQLDSDHEIYIKGTANPGYPAIYADLTNATAATINSLRQAFQIQKLYERDARGGSRFTEILLSHFGVTSPDARLQRPEFLGGRSTPIMITSVPQTSVTAATPQGNLAAYGTMVNTGDGFTKSFVEHGVIIGLCSVRADLTYQQGLQRMFSRSTRWDYYWPALAHIGEQAVYNKEIYCDGSGNDELVFGYQERYAEYRYGYNKITGKLRSTYTTPLDAWHLAQKFNSLPTLDTTFIAETPPVSRIVAVTSEPEFVLDSYLKIKCVRPMPVYAVPGLIDHF